MKHRLGVGAGINWNDRWNSWRDGINGHVNVGRCSHDCGIAGKIGDRAGVAGDFQIGGVGFAARNGVGENGNAIGEIGRACTEGSNTAIGKRQRCAAIHGYRFTKINREADRVADLRLIVIECVVAGSGHVAGRGGFGSGSVHSDAEWCRGRAGVVGCICRGCCKCMRGFAQTRRGVGPVAGTIGCRGADLRRAIEYCDGGSGFGGAGKQEGCVVGKGVKRQIALD